MPRFLLINPRAGAPTPDADALVRAASELDVRCHLLSNADDPAKLARQAAPGALGVAGGDGSLAAVAVDRDLPFVCIPSGRGTTSRATSASTEAIRSARSAPSTVSSDGSTSAGSANGCS